MGALVFAMISVAASGCVSSPTTLGGQCELTSECQAPLVCRYTYCRRECLSARDCGLGLRCLIANDGLGVCQLADEKRCERNSDCADGLYCNSGECTNACVTDRDCATGGRCVAAEGGATSCLFPEQSGCLYTSECAEPLVCASNECRLECAADVDCDGARVCVEHPACQGPCACRTPCAVDDECELGTVCVPAREGAAQPSFCDRVPTGS
ncbi:MAG: hypothetical protein KF901_29980 [Myxococcales bacterium]|nr:hypothetical protein [Myxococcales bacterium]